MKHSVTYIVQLLCTCCMLICLTWFTACKKFVAIAPPPDLLVSDQVFTDDAKATSVLTSIYGNMINGVNSFSNFQTTLFAGFSSDELNRFNPSAAYQELLSNSILPNNGQVKNLWLTAYKNIYYANAALEGLQASTALSPAVKMQLIGEAKFIRAFSYFYLLNLWGDVPLILTTDYRLNAIAPRTAANLIYDQVKADLLEAKTLLPNNTDRTRPNKWAAAAMLARICLYQQQWTAAEQQATELINSGIYTPLPASANVFLAASKEAIFQLVPTTGPVKEYLNIRPSGTTPQVYLPLSLVAKFSATDARKAKWIDSVTYQSVKYYYPAKYRSTASIPTEYYVVLRASEQYFIRAEARLQQGDLAGAIADVNVIKTRAGVSLLPANASAAQIATELEKERQLEFFAEWGHRWFDLKRWGKAATVLAPVKPGWLSRSELFPIPEDELLANPFLTQNPGY